MRAAGESASGVRAGERVRFHVPTLPGHLVIGELKNILLAGINTNPRTTLAECSDAADYVLLDFRHIEGRHVARTDPAKSVIVDYRDGVESLLPHDAEWYFKRSVVDQERRRFHRYERPVHPIGYCVKDDYLDREVSFAANRDIDISVFFDPDVNPSEVRNVFRYRVARFVREAFRHHRVFVGIAGASGMRGRNLFQAPYFDIMARSRIVVTCNPDRWEGDYRLYEALSSGALVLSDRMLTPVEHPFVDGRHLVYYDRRNLATLSLAIEMLLDDEDRRSSIARQGFRHAMKYHTACNRIDEIVDTLESG